MKFTVPRTTPTEMIPAVQGGRNGAGPILREDVLMQRMPRLAKQQRAEKDGAATSYAAEFGPDFAAFSKPGVPASHGKGVAHLLAGWKHNPNERRMVRTNRRK